MQSPQIYGQLDQNLQKPRAQREIPHPEIRRNRRTSRIRKKVNQFTTQALGDNRSINKWQVTCSMYKLLIDVIFTKFAWAVVSGYQDLIFALNSLTELHSLELLGMLLQIIGVTKEAVSMPYRTVWIFLDLNLASFLKSYGFSIIGKTFFWQFQVLCQLNFEYFNCKFL